MRRVAIAIAVAMACGLSVAAVSQSSPSPASLEENQKDKRETKKQSKVTDAAEFSQAVATLVLDRLRDGLEGHSSRLVLSAFDRDKLDGYLTLEAQIEAMFERYESFRVHYRVAQTTVEGSRGVALVDFDLEETPRSGGTAQRRSARVKFEMERGSKGWRIVEFNPRGFFS